MPVMTSYLMDKLMDHVLRQVPYKAPDQLYVALFRNKIEDDGKADEVTGPGYQRKPIIFGNKLFKGYLKNVDEVRFDVAAGDWGNVVEMALMDSKEGGHMLFHGPVGLRKAVEKGDQIRVNPGELVVRIYAL